MHKNGELWFDINHQPIQAHGGMIMQFNGTYYWYGEHKGGPNVLSKSGGRRVDFIGFSCYSSSNLIDWKNEGLILRADKENKESLLHPSQVGERPKVVYNEKNNNFVLWFHSDTWDYSYAGASVAVSDSPTGPFRYLRSFHPNGRDCRDMTVFKDDNGKAYLFHSTDFNKTMCISELDENYTDVTGFYTLNFIEQQREAPTVLHYKNWYYSVTSGCTGWKPNNALYAISRSLCSGWKLIDNPCTGKNYRKTFFGQSTYLGVAEGQPFLMLDHWKPDHLINSGYSILPVYLNEKEMDIPFVPEFNGFQ
ncbi:glycoside hydrolase family 43 protein [Sporolactobacillus shoreicorticis]|uniref:Glycoside hydrolase family 43 protein n=1 Tax=Sporolactobacillus shoreicorticis TaxID=1923877 RepID=A0ABW5S1A1_9BACL|nr:glycoside hydrolase family 43 protein [Sporolactobacillus shoreicorticis]MCO7124704.1 glycoside hydrolase family 43 protein [Sporolactobacillus shoreicorticis]